MTGTSRFALACTVGMALWAVDSTPAWGALETPNNIPRAYGAVDTDLLELLASSRSMIAAGEPNQAFHALTQYEARFGGTPQYDYWLGVAAARSGQWFESSIALQRVIQTNPRHAGARLELVGVLIQQGQISSAEHQLERLQHIIEQGGAPPQAEQAVARYQQLIAQYHEGSEAPTRLFMVGVDFGYDSNYLNYPDEFDIFANTAFAGLAIFDAEDTAFVGLRGNYWQQFEVNATDFVEVTVGANSRVNTASAASDFNTHLLAANVNYASRLENGAVVRLGVEAGAVALDTSYYRAHSGVSLGVVQPLGSSGQWHNRLYLRAFKFDSSRFNFNSYGWDTSYHHQHTGGWSSRLRLALEREDTVKRPTRQGGNLWRAHASARLSYQLNNQHRMSGELGYQGRRYQSSGFAVFNFGEARERSDDAMSYRLELQSQLSSRLRTNVFVQYRDQSSNIDFFDLDQVLVQGGMTYVF